ncbi:Protein CBG27979 [Caenorhabditis briggsae]|uniref:Protein CBG27979 n=2 Tax=Caenorhabditis briggsae TaxID=6238 RepID=B6IJS1_CAEBR|nr:Protein CBG27979 [Caenorhabditis briggsae]ULT83872.1 hypothetical protein L3Y34_012877 [Caenorhabditis briggsae]CAS00151.1 Protein CBG27979 [Caenorhabditis briggsae]
MNFDFLNSEEQRKLNQFMEITDSEDLDSAYQLLVRNRWDVEEAIGTFFSVGFSSLTVSENNRNDEASEEFGFADNEIPEIPIREPHAVESLMPSGNQTVLEKVQDFVRNFENQYSAADITLPSFYTDTLENAIVTAFNHDDKKFRKPMILFINNEDSTLTENFVKNVMCNQFVTDFSKEHFVLFPWDITEDSNLIQLCQMLTECSMRAIQEDLQNAAFSFSDRANFPLLMIIHRKRYSFEVIRKFNGRSDLNEVVNGLHEAYEIFQNDQLAEISKDLQQKEARELLVQQNAAYEQSLQADIERINSEKSLKEMEMEKKRKMELEQKKIAEEEDERVKNLSSQMPVEPDDTNPDCITVRFRLPENGIDTRRFLKTDSIRTLINYLETKRFFKEKFTFLNSELPRKDIIKTFALEKSFFEANWPKKETVLVEMKKSDD